MVKYLVQLNNGIPLKKLTLNILNPTEHQVMLHKCGRIGLESPLLRLSVNQVAFNGTNLFVPEKLGIICKVKMFYFMIEI